MYAVIVGCGRVGSMLAGILSSRGDNIVIIDEDEERFQRLDRQFTGETLAGDGTSILVLKESGIEKADALIMATNDDNSNLMGAQLAKKMFGVKRVIVRLKNPGKFSVYREYSLEMVSATTLAAEKIADIISTPPDVEILGSMGSGRGRIVRMRVPSEAACGALARLVSQGVFHPLAVSEGEKFDMGFRGESISPGVVVVGGILTDNIKHLKKCCVEEKL